MEPTPGGDRFSSLDELQRQLNEDFAQSIGPLTPTPDNAGAASGTSAGSSGGTIATTISTVVLQGGPLQLVVAILKFPAPDHLLAMLRTVQETDLHRQGDRLESGEKLYIKVADLQPKFTFLGPSLDDALKLQNEHDALLRQIQNLPTPLEEFYRKIQEKIASNERPNPKLIEEMAASLNAVWHDIKKMLAERREIVALNVSFFERLGEAYGKMSSLEVACNDTMIPIEIDAVREFLDSFRNLRGDMLAAISSTLKAGNQMLDRLRVLADLGTLDSRPNHIKLDAAQAIGQVEAWLEDLSNRRNQLEQAWLSRKTQLEQCLTLAILAKELAEIEQTLARVRSQNLSSFTLGESAEQARDLLETYQNLKPEAALLRDKTLKITKATEELLTTGCFAGDEACAKAYSVLSACSELLEEIDRRESLLGQSREFFGRATTILKRLDQLELEFGSSQARPSSSNDLPAHQKLLQDIRESIGEVLQMGYSLVDDVGRTKPEVAGVQAMIERIELRKLTFERYCNEESERNVRASQALNEFFERYGQLVAWLEEAWQERIVRGCAIHRMGENVAEAKDCLLLHHQFLNDLEIKGNAINNLLVRLTSSLEQLADEQRDDVQRKIDLIRQKWIELKNYVIERVDLLKLYIKFHQEAETLRNQFDAYAIQFATFKDNPADHSLILAATANIRQTLESLRTIGAQCVGQLQKSVDPYLQKTRAAQCVERTVAEFAERQLAISNEWESWNARRRTETTLKQIMAANMETLAVTTKLEEQLYPIFSTALDNPTDLLEFIDRKRAQIQADIRTAEMDLTQRFDAIAQLESDATASVVEDIVAMKNNLNSIKTKLHSMGADFAELSEPIEQFLRSIVHCRDGIKEYFATKQTVTDLGSVEAIAEGYEQFKQGTMEHFRSLLQQSEQIIERIKAQEPPGAKEMDTDKIITLLENLRTYFESQTESENSELKKQHSVLAFDRELNDVRGTIRTAGEQLQQQRGNYGTNLAEAQTAKVVFEEYATSLQELKERVDTFLNSGAELVRQYPETSPYVESETNKIRNEWSELLRKLEEHRTLYNIAIEYFTLISSVEDNYRTLNAELINANNKLTILNNVDVANDLVTQVDATIRTHETQQLDTLKHISSLSTRLYGCDKTVTIYTENTKLFQTFYKIKTEVYERAKELAEQQRQREEEQQRQEELQREQELQRRKEQERLEQLQREQEEQRIELERLEQLHLAEEQQRLEQQRLEQLRLEEEKLRLEQQRLEQLQREQEQQRLEQQRLEQLQLEEEKLRLEQQRLEQQRLEQLQREQEQQRAEQERLEQLRLEEEKLRLEQGRLEQQRLEQLQREKEQQLLEQQRLEQLRLEEEKLRFEHDRLEQQRLEQLQREQELASQQQKEREAPSVVEEVKITTTSHSSLPHQQQSFDVQTIDEEQYLQEPQAPLVIQTVEEQIHEQIHEVVTTTSTLSSVQTQPQQEVSLCFVQPLADVCVQEGQRARLQCVVAGFPDPTIEWYKDGISVQGNSDYRTGFDAASGVCTLVIDETVTADSANIVCRATNDAGVADTTARLLVTEVPPPPKPEGNAPVFTMKLLDGGVAQEGQPFQYDCIVTGTPLPTVHWFKADRCIDGSPDYRQSYDPASGVASLRIEQVYLEDQTHYTCRAVNDCGSDETTAFLTVKPLEPTEFPDFPEPLSNVMARVGQKIRLEAKVTGTPQPDLMWTHNGKHFTNREVKFFYENGRAQLVIDEAFLKDAGVYTLTAKNIAGEKCCSCNVVVKGRLPNETSDSELASDMEPVKPSVQLALRDVSVFEGKPVRLDCVIVGQPEPEVIWYHGERPVKESADFQLLFQGDRCSLVIREAFVEDAGEYRVVAINSAGEASSQCALIVTPLNATGGVPAAVRQQPAVERVPAVTGSPPRFERLLADILADEGERVQFECAVSGDPRPNIRWYVNNREIATDVAVSPRVHCVVREDGVVKLIIERVLPDDKGVYTVKAVSPAGEAKCFSNLIVKSINAPEFEAVPAFLTESQLCPTFRELFADRVVRQHEPTKFECIVVGKPQPKIRWFFNDQPVQGHDFLVSTSGDRQVLTIPEVRPELTGKITCYAENEAGNAQCVAIVQILEQLAGGGFPATPQLPTLQTTGESMQQVDTSGSSCVTLQKHVTTTSSSSFSSSSSATVQQNGVVAHSEVHAESAKQDRSFKQVNDLPPEVAEAKQFQRYDQVNDQPAVIQQEASSFLATGGAEMHESIIANSGQISTGKPARRNTAPRFVTPFNGKIVDQGADVVIEGIVDGYPTPDVKITKNDVELQPDGERISVSYSLNKIVVELRNVSPLDAGRYTATASNAAGASTSTADLVVKKSIFPPVFGRRLQAQTVRGGDRVVLDVEVTGTPEPSVAWFRDDRPVQETLALGSYALQQVGSCHKLIFEQIRPADSGKYMVLAKNAGGEAQSIADIAVLECESQAAPAPQPAPQKHVSFVDMVQQQQPKSDEPFDSSAADGGDGGGFSARREFAAESMLHGPMTESTVVTETRRTTEATMRMEHKIHLPDLPVRFSQRTQTPTVPTVTEGTSPATDETSTTTGTNTEHIVTRSDATQTATVTPTPTPSAPAAEQCSAASAGAVDQSDSRQESASIISSIVRDRPTNPVVQQPTNHQFDLTAQLVGEEGRRAFVQPPPPPPPSSLYRRVAPAAAAAAAGQDTKSSYPPAAAQHQGPLSGGDEVLLVVDAPKKVDFLRPQPETIPTPPIFNLGEGRGPSDPYHQQSGPPKFPHAEPLKLTRARSSSPRPSAEAIAMEKLWTAPKAFTGGAAPWVQEEPPQVYRQYRPPPTLTTTMTTPTSMGAPPAFTNKHHQQNTTEQKQQQQQQQYSTLPFARNSKKPQPHHEHQPAKARSDSLRSDFQPIYQPAGPAAVQQPTQMYSSFSSTQQFQQASSTLSQQQYSQSSMQYQPYKPSLPVDVAPVQQAPPPAQSFPPQVAVAPAPFKPAPAPSMFTPAPAPAPAPTPKFAPAPVPAPAVVSAPLPQTSLAAGAGPTPAFLAGPSYNQTPQPFKPLPPPAITPSSLTNAAPAPAPVESFVPQTYAQPPQPQPAYQAPAPAPVPTGPVSLPPYQEPLSFSSSQPPAVEPLYPGQLGYQPPTQQQQAQVQFQQPPQAYQQQQQMHQQMYQQQQQQQVQQQYYVEQQQQEEVYKKMSVKETKKLFEESLLQQQQQIHQQQLQQQQQVSYGDLKAPRLVQGLRQPGAGGAPGASVLPADFGYGAIAELGLEPGPQPTMGYAPKQASSERKSSYYREQIEQSLLENMDKEPERVPAGGVKIIPPSPRKKSRPAPAAGQSDTGSGGAPAPFEQPKAEELQPGSGIQTTAKSPFTATESEYESDLDGGVRKQNGYLADTEEVVQKSVSFASEVQQLQQQQTIESSFSSSSKVESHHSTVVSSSSTSSEVVQQQQQQQVQEQVLEQQQQQAPVVLPVTETVATEEQQQQQISKSEEVIVSSSETVQQETVEESSSKNFLVNNDLPEDLQPVKVLPTEEPLPTLKHVPVPAAVQPPVVEQFVEPQQQQQQPQVAPVVQPEPVSVAAPAPAPVLLNGVGYPAPSPAQGAFVSDYESDAATTATPTIAGYKPVHPVFAPVKQDGAVGPAVPPPSVFDPIDKIQPNQIKPADAPKIEKPKAINYVQQQQQQQQTMSYQQQSFQQQSFQQQQTYQMQQQQQQSFPPAVQSVPAQYYTSVTGQPVHNTIATETSNTLHLKEMTESSNRVLNMQQTQSVISLEQQQQQQQQQYRQTSSSFAPKPGRFTPGEYRDSDGYESDGTRIRPLWTPNPSDSDEPHYRSVRPNFQQPRSTSLPRQYERIQTPMEFDTLPVQMPSRIDVSTEAAHQRSQSLSRQTIETTQTTMTTQTTSTETLKTQTLDRYGSKRLATTPVPNTRDDMAVKAHRVAPISYIQKQAQTQADGMAQTFKTKAYHFSNEVMTDIKKTPIKPILKNAYAAPYAAPTQAQAPPQSYAPVPQLQQPAPTAAPPQAYREESRVSQYGTKHIDPDTGIIYFKYDFGYEFGIIFPGEGHRIVAGRSGGGRGGSGSGSGSGRKHPRYLNAAQFARGDIAVPVLHERTKDYDRNCRTGVRSASVPATEMHASARYGPVPFGTTQPMSFYGGSGRSTPSRGHSNRNSYCATPDPTAQGFNRSTTSTPNVKQQHQEEGVPTKTPLFVAPLKDIAVVSGQPARFECIVACDATPSIRWTKDEAPIEEGYKFVPEYRNGVCRLSLPVAYEGDAGRYCCLAENHLGYAATCAELTVANADWRVNQ